MSELIDVNLKLTSKELSLLSAAVCEYFHNIKVEFGEGTYGALITDDTVLAARDLWRKVEAQTGVDRW